MSVEQAFPDQLNIGDASGLQNSAVTGFGGYRVILIGT